MSGVGGGEFVTVYKTLINNLFLILILAFTHHLGQSLCIGNMSKVARYFAPFSNRKKRRKRKGGNCNTEILSPIELLSKM